MSFIGRLTDYNDPNSFGSKMRRRRAAFLEAMIERCWKNKGTVSIVDMGGEIAYWNIFSQDYLAAHEVSITLINLHQENLPENPHPDVFTNVIGNCCNLTYPDNSFDIAHSNSVIEHLIDWTRMSEFAGQARRLAPWYYVQTPSFWFPIEPHFGAPCFHWLPEPVRISLVMRRAMGQYPKAANLDIATHFIHNTRLLDRKQFAYLFPDATIKSEKLFGLAKSYVAVRQ